MLFSGQRVYRVIAHDRPGHGRSDQTWDANDLDTYAVPRAACESIVGISFMNFSGSLRGLFRTDSRTSHALAGSTQSFRISLRFSPFVPSSAPKKTPRI
jgi:pimeloyl-ACP methyl ester carboxylesterase